MAGSSRRGAVEVEEQWDPIRLGLGIVVILLLISVVYAGIVFVGMWNQHTREFDSCVSYHEEYGQYLTALSTGNEALCDQAHDPLLCRAAVTKNPRLCGDLDNDEDQLDCLLMATEDTTHCRHSLPYCAVLLGESAGHCSSLVDFDAEICKATAQRNVNNYVQLNTNNCHNNAWTRVGYENVPEFIATPILKFYDHYFAFDYYE